MVPPLLPWCRVVQTLDSCSLFNRWRPSERRSDPYSAVRSREIGHGGAGHVTTMTLHAHAAIKHRQSRLLGCIRLTSLRISRITR